MSDPSPEAVVASEAAANAVEELHAREEVDQAATEAIITADIAVETAAMAANDAESAQQNGAIALDAAAEAAQTAEAAIEQNQALAYATADAFQEFRASQDQKMREMREYIDSRIPLPTVSPTNEVEEVEVHGTDVSNSGGQSESATGSESGKGASNPAEKRYGLKHRNSRR